MNPRAPLILLAIFLTTLTSLAPASSTCWISADCENADDLICTGQDCTSGTGWVECDGFYRTCPNCSQNDGICNSGLGGPCYYDADCCPQDGYCGPECNDIYQDPDCCPYWRTCNNDWECGSWGYCSFAGTQRPGHCACPSL